jgi:uncharacterized protein YkwD
MARRFTIGRLTMVAVSAILVAAFVQSSPASAAVTQSITNAAPTSDTSGYAWVSYFRGLAGLGGVTRNPTMEAQEAAHVRYLANHSLSCETNVHDELTTRIGACGGNRYATAAGKAAANNSNITRVSAAVPDRTAVASWFTSGFHALTLLDPRLHSTGFAAYYTPTPTGAGPLAWRYTAGVDVYRGRSGGYNGSTIAFPANNAATPLLSYTVGTESPEPFRTTTAASRCHSWGSRSVVSSPVIVQWPLAAAVSAGSGAIIDLTAGTTQPTCSLTRDSYPSGSLPWQLLGGANGITKSAMYYAANPFVPGHRYRLRVAGALLSTFTAAGLPSGPALTASGIARGSRTSWTAPTSAGTGAITQYVVKVHLGTGCSSTIVAGLALTQRSLTVGGLTPGRYYSIRVAAVNSASGSRWSNCVLIRSG